MRHAVSLVLASVLLSACGLSSPLIKSESLAYDDAIEDTSNKLLLLNVLRARDKAPLHFAQVPLIHGSIQETANLQATAPVGPPRNNSTTRAGATATLGLQISPSFDIAHLNSKDFVTGMASPVEPKFVKYWLDRGLDKRIVLLLFFSAAEIVEPMPDGTSRVIRIMNSPREAIDAITQNREKINDPSPTMRCDALSDFQRYLKLINSLTTFFAHAYIDRRLLADNVKLDPAKDVKDIEGLATLDPAKVQWERQGGTYSLYAVSPDPVIALCYYQSGTQSLRIFAGPGAGPDRRGGCYQDVVTEGLEAAPPPPREIPVFHLPAPTGQPSDYCQVFNRFIDAGAGAAGEGARLQLRLQLRSPGEMIQFLGDLVEYQAQVARFVEMHPHNNLRLNVPVTFGYCADTPEALRGGCDDVFFALHHDSCRARFTVSYRGDSYSVRKYGPPRGESEDGPQCNNSPGERDHTLEVLAVITELVDLRKSASDIRTTPYVQVVP